MKRLFTCESVTSGHPDKVADQISDAIVDAILAKDKDAHTAIETFCTYDTLIVAGEVKTKEEVDYEAIAREKVREIGYDKAEWGFKFDEIKFMNKIHAQSTDIDNKVSLNEEVGAGDQGMMFGYASNETENYMPLAYDLASKLCKKLEEVRKNTLSYLGPDGKSQVTVEYEDGKIKRVDTVVISSQHSASVDLDTLRKDVKELVVDKVVPSELVDENTKYLINATGAFVIGGPVGDSGLTGRKIIVDTYGGYAPHGGGAFSGKDPSKVDRSAAYYSRYVAKHIVAAKLADEACVQVAYVIGLVHPVSVNINTYGTNHVPMEVIYDKVAKTFDFRVSNIINSLKLKETRYQYLASYGHFGRDDINPSFEHLDRLEDLINA